jgi:putative addiction module killer protein
VPITLLRTAALKAWLDGLDDAVAKEAIARRTVRMQSGLMGDTKAVGGKVAEARVDVGPGYRIYYTRRGREIILLLCGGDKSSQSADVKRAKAMVAELDEAAKAKPKKGPSAAKKKTRK